MKRRRSLTAFLFVAVLIFVVYTNRRDNEQVHRRSPPEPQAGKSDQIISNENPESGEIDPIISPKPLIPKDEATSSITTITQTSTVVAHVVDKVIRSSLASPAHVLPHVHINLENWSFNGSSMNKSYLGAAIAPGDIYLDLQRNGFISDPLIGDNDKVLRWVGRTDWTYQTTVMLTPDLIQKKVILLNIQGLDTIATVKIGDVVVAQIMNQFHQEIIDIKKYITVDSTALNISIFFRSPVNYALETSKAYMAQYKHVIPPDCWPNEFSGECHINFIRKVQSSFGWDWGPSFPTVGIWQPISIEAFDFVYITHVTAQTIKDGDNFCVLVEIFAYSAITADDIQATVLFDELSISQSLTVSLKADQLNQIAVNVTIPIAKIQLWFPHGHGNSTLYSIRVMINDTNGRCVTSDDKKIGFRSIELVQDYVDKNPSKGRYFYFKVNDIPIFLKGSNWIPLSSFPGRVDDDRIDFLLHSTVEANMNALRVWGGGRYESDHFYEMADELGILIWQDMMFACAEYPTDPKFIENVEREFTTQVQRIKHHASILVWSGNNENEFGIASGWWGGTNYPREQMKKDYSILYMDRMKPLIERLDHSRPFLLSSPTNGIESEKAGGIASRPNDNHYGDIHFYVDHSEMWSEHSWQIPRCASEYGVQSFPMGRTLNRALPGLNLTYDTQQLTNRQHRPGGHGSLPRTAFAHFPLPSECGGKQQTCFKSTEFLDRFIYFTQIHQAFAYQSQTEHYLRWRSRLNDQGLGWTMCALYWQLNDIWAAPTWSSIDFDLNWKPVHYMARRFFAPILISTYVDSNGLLHLFIVSDKHESFQATLIYEAFLCNQTCTNLTGELRFNVSVSAFSSVEVGDATTLRSTLSTNGSKINYDEIVDRCRLLSETGTEITIENIRLGVNIMKTDGSQYGNVHISTVKGLSDREYEIDLVASGFAPLIWLDLTESRPGWFSDNLFTMLGDGNRTITFSLFKSPNRTLTIEDFTICSFGDCGNRKSHKTQ